jgi:hypothetical protein
MDLHHILSKERVNISRHFEIAMILRKLQHPIWPPTRKFEEFPVAQTKKGLANAMPWE